MPDHGTILPPQVSPSLEVREPSLSVRSRVCAQGVQIYDWTPATASWALRGPEATLTDAAGPGPAIGRHHAGPTWELDDGSRVTGRLIDKTAAPRPDAIPWLLLEVTSDVGAGRLAGVRRIQRVETEGGLPPGEPPREGEPLEVRVAYRAVYYFWGPART